MGIDGGGHSPNSFFSACWRALFGVRRRAITIGVTCRYTANHDKERLQCVTLYTSPSQVRVHPSAGLEGLHPSHSHHSHPHHTSSHHHIGSQFRQDSQTIKHVHRTKDTNADHDPEAPPVIDPASGVKYKDMHTIDDGWVDGCALLASMHCRCTWPPMWWKEQLHFEPIKECRGLGPGDTCPIRCQKCFGQCESKRGTTPRQRHPFPSMVVCATESSPGCEAAGDCRDISLKCMPAGEIKKPAQFVCHPRHEDPPKGVIVDLDGAFYGGNKLTPWVYCDEPSGYVPYDLEMAIKRNMVCPASPESEAIFRVRKIDTMKSLWRHGKGWVHFYVFAVP